MVFGVVAVKGVRAAIIFEREDLRRHLVQKKTIVANGNDRAVVFVESSFERFASGMSR